MNRSKRQLISMNLYRVLLLLYPSAHRAAYGHLMSQAFRDQCRDADPQGNPAWFALWWRTLIDVAHTAILEHLASRKARIMQSIIIKNQPDRLTGLLFLIPGLVLSIFYLITIHSGEMSGYLWAAVVGAAGFGLGFLKRLRRVRIWEQFFVGFVIGALGFVIIMISSPMLNLGIPVLRTQPWPTVRAVLAVGLYLGVVGLLGRRVRGTRRLFWVTSGILLVIGLIQAILPIGPNEDSLYLWDLSWSWGYISAILGIVVLGLRLSGRTGILALLAVIVALGTLNAITLGVADIAVGRTFLGQITLVLSYLVPLVICPAWLLLAQSWPRKKQGVLLSWGAMLLITGVVLPVVDVVVEPHFFRWMRLENNVLYGIVFSLMPNLPLFIGLWLAFTLYERHNRQLAIAGSESSTDAPLPWVWLSMMS